MNFNPPRYKVIAGLMILVFILYFLVGGIAALFKLITIDSYLIWAGIVGGTASVIGLLSFFQPALTRDDIKELELETLKELAETSGQLTELKQVREATKQDIDTLALQKRR